MVHRSRGTGTGQRLGPARGPRWGLAGRQVRTSEHPTGPYLPPGKWVSHLPPRDGHGTGPALSSPGPDPCHLVLRVEIAPPQGGRRTAPEEETAAPGVGITPYSTLGPGSGKSRCLAGWSVRTALPSVCRAAEPRPRRTDR